MYGVKNRCRVFSAIHKINRQKKNEKQTSKYYDISFWIQGYAKLAKIGWWCDDEEDDKTNRRKMLNVTKNYNYANGEHSKAQQ